MRRSRRRAGRRLNRRRLTAGAAGMVAVAVLAIGVHLMERRQRAVFEGAEAQTLRSGAQETLELLERTKETVKDSGGETAVIKVEDTVITGLSSREARDLLLRRYSGPLQVRAGEETQELKNPVEQEIDRLLGLAPDMASEDLELKFDNRRMEEAVQEQVTALAGKWDREPVNSVVASYDTATGIYEYSKEKEGRTLDREDLTAKIMERIQAGDYKEPVEAAFKVIPPERTQAQAKAQYKVIGTFTTKLTSNKNRNKNVTLAAEAINGRVLQPGEEFSFNGATGNRTSEKGYQPAGAYRNGVLIEEPGGGVCQVSTTLYHSIIKAGFKTTERNAHSFSPSYVEKGQDAMVSFDGYAGPDLKFVNTSKTPVVLRALVQGLELKMSIVGLPVLEEGVEVSIRSEKVRDIEQPEPVYEENPELPYGTEKVVEEGQKGSVWKSYRVVTKNGELVEETPLHNSSYKAKTRQVQLNTTAPGNQEVQPQEGIINPETEGGNPETIIPIGPEAEEEPAGGTEPAESQESAGGTEPAESQGPAGGTVSAESQGPGGGALSRG
ncbi:MAG: VanW family protein [Clostridium sp.]|nr:VanW family protein [Clostridium sp.]